MFRTIDTPYDLSAFSPQQLYRIKWKLRERMLKGMGWQPFGLDSSTLWACYPGFMRAFVPCGRSGSIPEWGFSV